MGEVGEDKVPHMEQDVGDDQLPHVEQEVEGDHHPHVGQEDGDVLTGDCPESEGLGVE